MNLTEWLAFAILDVQRRDLSELRPVLEALARSTASLRDAHWNADASGTSQPDEGVDGR